MDPTIKVTRIGNRWHARMLIENEVRDEMACEYQCDIRLICREMLRWYNKTGGDSRYADRARHRQKSWGAQGMCGAKGKTWWHCQTIKV